VRDHEQAVSICAVSLEVDESGQRGQTDATYLLTEIVGQYAQGAAEGAGPSDAVLIGGERKSGTTAAS
jgi:hypothetical protein